MTLAANQFYCVGCRKKVMAKNVHKKSAKNPRNHRSIPMLRGTCNACGGKVARIVKGSSRSVSPRRSVSRKRKSGSKKRSVSRKRKSVSRK